MPTITLADQKANTADITGPYTSNAFTPAADDQIWVVAMAAGVDPALAPGTCTSSAGLTFTLVNSRVFGGTSAQYLFRSNQRATAVSQTVTFDCTGDVAAGCNLTTIRVAGGDDIQRQFGSTNDVGGTVPTVTAGTVLSTSAFFSVAGNLANPSALTAPTGWTTSVEVGYGTPSRGTSFSKRDSGQTSTTIAWSSSATAWGMYAVEIGLPTNTSTGASTLGGLASDATGTQAVGGSAASTTGALASAGMGVGSLGSITGTATASLAGLQSTATGAQAAGGVATSVLGGLQSLGAGSVGSAVSGSATSTLGALTSAATGSATLSNVTSTGGATLGALRSSATGNVPLGPQFELQFEDRSSARYRITDRSAARLTLTDASGPRLRLKEKP